jgi:hypothetical protein
MLGEKLKKTWKSIILLTTWLALITAAFIIPLPSWNATDDNSSFFTKFGILVATVIAGFLVLYSLKNKVIKTWMRLSILFLVLFVITYGTYNILRGANTLPYGERDIVIGNEMLPDNPFEIFEESHGFMPDKNEQMMIVLGDPEKVWVKKGITFNRAMLMLSLFLCFLFFTVLMISFCNLIILKREEAKEE